MHHFVASAPWDDHALAQMERHAPVAAWMIDETGLPKKGKHTAGVPAQYCGALGKTANCQVAVKLSLVNETMSVPAAWRLYLPEVWAGDEARRKRAGVPDGTRFLRKWEIAREEIDRLLEEELPPAPVVADAG